MTCLRWSMALLTLGLLAPEAAAQGYLVPSPYGRVSGGSLTYSRGRPGKGLSFSLGSFTTRGFYAGPFAPFDPFPYGPRGRVTVFYSVAPPPPPVVLLPTPFFLEGLPPGLLPRNELVAPPGPGEPPPVPDDVPRLPVPPVAPDPPMPKPPEPKKEEPKPPPKPPEKKKPTTLPRRPGPEADPARENARLVGLGEEAFAAGAYGRAALRFRRATEVDPLLPRAHFLLAQALVALGKYHEAVESAHAGLTLDPKWPASGFRPLALYGDNLPEYSEHLRALEEALERHPGDPVLLFLTAYQLWFDGRKEEARPLFRAARPGAADQGAVDAFLRATPPGPAL